MAAAATSEQQIFCNFSSTGSASLDEHEHGLVDGAARIGEALDELGDVATGVRRHEVHALPVDVQRQDCDLGRLAPARRLPGLRDRAAVVGERVPVEPPRPPGRAVLTRCEGSSRA
jgi:hypothetical protein